MQCSSTKEKIIDSALTLFSENGIESTSVEQIASSVGVKAPALYKHFKSKKDIVDSIFLKIFEHYSSTIEKEQSEIESCLAKLKEHEGSTCGMTEKAAGIVCNVIEEVFVESIQDEFLNKALRLTQIEHFHFERFASLYENEFHDRLMNPSEKLLSLLIEKSILKKEDLEIMTAQFVSPIIILFDICRNNIKKKEYAMDFISRHIKQFFRIYSK